jgi:GNAT superfamily N-acetyltransferase
VKPLFQIRQINISEIDAYEKIPMSFRVDSVFDVEIVDQALGGFRLTERVVDEPWVKDYLAEGHTALPGWIDDFDGANWTFFLAEEDGHPIGGATAASRTPSMHMLDGRDDLAVLADIRINPLNQRSGIAKALVNRVIEWSRDEGLTQLKIETQNINVPGCRFYASMGCELRGVVHHAYYEGPDMKDEIMFLWWLDL